MKFLAIHPGASYSTADVFTGYLSALRSIGVECIEYRTDQRMAVAEKFTAALFRQANKGRAADQQIKPEVRHIVWQACSEIVAQALWHKVDAVLWFSLQYLHPDMLVLLRRARMPSVAILTESPYQDARHAELLRYIDVAFTNERSSVAPLRVVNEDVYYLPPAYDPAIHHAGRHFADNTVEAYDVVFVGTGFQERLDLLAGVDWAGINLGLFGTYDLLPSRHPLRKHIRGGVVPNAQAAALYRRAKIGLNLYRKTTAFHPGAPHITHAESLNPRAVELAACGAFHLSDERAEVREVFWDTVPTFDSPQELEFKVRHYLAYPDERAALAAQLPDRVKGWTFADRAKELVSTLRTVWHGANTARSA